MTTAIGLAASDWSLSTMLLCRAWQVSEALIDGLYRQLADGDKNVLHASAKFETVD
jgi:hypothetical protein